MSPRTGAIVVDRPEPFERLQALLAHAVDAARALPAGSISRRGDVLIDVYIASISGAVTEAREMAA